MKHNDFPGNPNPRSMPGLRSPEVMPEPQISRAAARAAVLAGLNQPIEEAEASVPALAPLEGEWISAERVLDHIPVKMIVRSRYQPRLFFDEKSIEELATSIQTIGLGKPIIVRPLPNGQFELIGGERRWRAVQLNGGETILAVIQDMSDSFAMVLAITDNSGEPLTDYEHARQYQLILQDGKEKSQRALARRLGVNVSTVNRCLTLMQLPESVRTVLDKNPSLITSNYAKQFVDFAGAHPVIVEKTVTAMVETGVTQEAALRLIAKEIASLNNVPAPAKLESRAVKGFGTIKMSGTRLELKCEKDIDVQLLGQKFEQFLRSLDPEAVRIEEE
jgi:ParB family chromosome partitioning protein